MNQETEQQIEAAVFHRLILHLRENTSLQNIDLMNLAGFCRNCLARWYQEAAEKRNITLSKEDTREKIYGMDYESWKQQNQK